MALLCRAPWDCRPVASVALLCCLEFLVKEKGERNRKPGVFTSQGQPIYLISYLIKPEVKTTEQAFSHFTDPQVSSGRREDRASILSLVIASADDARVK